MCGDLHGQLEDAFESLSWCVLRVVGLEGLLFLHLSGGVPAWIGWNDPDERE